MNPNEGSGSPAAEPTPLSSEGLAQIQENLLQDLYDDRLLNDCYQDNLGQVAQEIVLYGPEAVLTGVPLGVFGGLLTLIGIYYAARKDTLPKSESKVVGPQDLADIEAEKP